MSTNIPTVFNDISKCQAYLKSNLSAEDKTLVNKLIPRVYNAAVEKKGLILVIQANIHEIAQCTAIFLGLVTREKTRELKGIKISYVPIPRISITPQNNIYPKVENANLVILDNILTLEKFKSKPFLQLLSAIEVSGGIGIVPHPFSSPKKMSQEFTEAVSQYLFNSHRILVNLKGV